MYLLGKIDLESHIYREEWTFSDGVNRAKRVATERTTYWLGAVSINGLPFWRLLSPATSKELEDFFQDLQKKNTSQEGENNDGHSL